MADSAGEEVAGGILAAVVGPFIMLLFLPLVIYWSWVFQLAWNRLLVPYGPEWGQAPLTLAQASAVIVTRSFFTFRGSKSIPGEDRHLGTNMGTIIGAPLGVLLIQWAFSILWG